MFTRRRLGSKVSKPKLVHKVIHCGRWSHLSKETRAAQCQMSLQIAKFKQGFSDLINSYIPLYLHQQFDRYRVW